MGRSIRLHQTTDPLVVSYGLTADLAEAEAVAGDYDGGDDYREDPQGFITRTLEARTGSGGRR